MFDPHKFARAYNAHPALWRVRREYERGGWKSRVVWDCRHPHVVARKDAQVVTIGVDLVAHESVDQARAWMFSPDAL